MSNRCQKRSRRTSPVSTGVGAAPASPLKRLRRLPPVEWLVSYLFGDDVFISHSRADGMRYGGEPAHRLSDAGYSVRMDLWETPPGKRTPEKVLSARRRCRSLVVVATPGAARSPNVAEELAFYRRTHPDTNITPLRFGAGLPAAVWAEQVEGLPWLVDTRGAPPAGPPGRCLLFLSPPRFTIGVR